MSEHNSQRVAKNTVFLFTRMILVMGVSLFTSRIVLRTLGVEDFGIYNVVGSVVVFFSFLQAALRNATYRYLAFELGTGNSETLDRVYSMAVNSHVLLAFSLLVILEIGGVWFLNAKLVIPDDRIIAANWTFQFSLVSFCIGIIRTPFESNIIAHENMDFYAVISILESVAKLVIVYVLLLIPYDKLITYAFLMMAMYLIISFCYYLYCKIKFQDCKYRKCWDSSILRQFCSYSGWSLLVNASCIIRTQSFGIFFNLFLGVVANAALGIANQVISALNSFVDSFTQAFNPQIIKSYAAKDMDYFNNIIISTSKLSYYLLLIISLPIILNINFVLKLWLGEYPEMTPFLIETIILYYLIDAMQSPLVTAVHATGRLKIHQISISVIVALVIPVSYFMLKAGFPAYSIFVVNAISNFLCAITRVIIMKHLINLDILEYVRNVVLPIMIVSITTLPIPLYLSLMLPDSWNSVFIISFSALILSIISVLFFGLNKSERQLMKEMASFSRLFN